MLISDAIFEDSRAAEIFWTLFDAPDEAFDPKRDQALFAAAVERLVALGYDASTADEFLRTELSYCDD